MPHRVFVKFFLNCKALKFNINSYQNLIYFIVEMKIEIKMTILVDLV